VEPAGQDWAGGVGGGVGVAVVVGAGVESLPPLETTTILVLKPAYVPERHHSAAAPPCVLGSEVVNTAFDTAETTQFTVLASEVVTVTVTPQGENQGWEVCHDPSAHVEGMVCEKLTDPPRGTFTVKGPHTLQLDLLEDDLQIPRAA